MNDGQYFFPGSEHLVPQPDRAFESAFQPEIRAWLMDANTTQAQKEAFLQALLDFHDDCGGFYQLRSFLLAAEYLALCPECRQGDAIIDRLLKLSYGYFRVEKADWCMPPKAFVRSARETLARSDLGRVVPRLEAMIRQTESRAVMHHAACELLRIQPGNRCGIAAIAFERLIPETSQKNTSLKGRKIIQPLWDNALRALASQVLESDEVSEAVIHTLSLTCSNFERYKLAEIAEVHRTLDRMIQLAPNHPVVLPALLELMGSVSSIASYCPTEAEQWTAPIKTLYNLVKQGDPECLNKLVQQLDDWEEAKSINAPHYLVLKALGKLGHQNEKVTQRVLRFLEKPNDPTSVLDEYIRFTAVETLGEIQVNQPNIVKALVHLFENTSTPSDKYTIAVALRKLDKHQLAASAFIVGTIKAFIESEFEIFLNHSVGVDDEYSDLIWRRFQDAFLFEETLPLAINGLKRFIQVKPCHQSAISLLARFEPDYQLAIDACLLKLRELPDTETYYIWRVLHTLSEIGRGNEQVIQAIEHFLQTATNLNSIGKAANTLHVLQSGNPAVIPTLEKTLIECDARTNFDYWFEGLNTTVTPLITHQPSHELVRQQLLKRLEPDTSMRLWHLQSISSILARISLGDGHDFLAVVKQLQFINQEDWRNNDWDWLWADWVEILSEDAWIKLLTQLKIPRNWLYDVYHTIVWQCAQRLPYATFHQAWQSEAVAVNH
jgi:hypothetical protein